jgi:hypothetical protein
MAIYKVDSKLLVDIKKCLIDLKGEFKMGESILAWSRRREKARKKSEKLIKTLENEYYI